MPVDSLICPYCGRVIPGRGSRVHLPPTTTEVWHALQAEFARRVTLGVSDVARITCRSKQAAYYHLRVLHRVGLVEPVPIRENGQYVRYRAV